MMCSVLCITLSRQSPQKGVHTYLPTTYVVHIISSHTSTPSSHSHPTMGFIPLAITLLAISRLLSGVRTSSKYSIEGKDEFVNLVDCNLGCKRVAWLKDAAKQQRTCCKLISSCLMSTYCSHLINF